MFDEARLAWLAKRVRRKLGEKTAAPHVAGAMS